MEKDFLRFRLCVALDQLPLYVIVAERELLRCAQREDQVFFTKQKVERQRGKQDGSGESAWDEHAGDGRPADGRH